RQAGAGEIEEWRNRPHRNGYGNRGGVAALFVGGGLLSASPVFGDLFRQQRKYAGRARESVHGISQRPPGNQDRRYSWCELRKKTEHWCGMESSRASGKS